VVLKEHRRGRRRTVRSHQTSDCAQRSRERTAVSGGQGRNRSDQVFLNGDRGSTQQTPALQRDSEPLTTPVLGRDDFGNEPLLYKPLNHNRHGALMRTRERRDIVDGRIGMLGDLLQREQLRAAEPSRVSTAAAGPQRLHYVPEGVERDTHIGRMCGARRLRRPFRDSPAACRRTGVHTARGPSRACA